MNIPFTPEQVQNVPKICDAATRFVGQQIAQGGLATIEQGALNLQEIAAFLQAFQKAAQAEQQQPEPQK